MTFYAANDGRYPDDSPVEVWYPTTADDAGDRARWAWLPGSILGQTGPDEWHVVVEVRALAEPEPGAPRQHVADLPDHQLRYPACYRDAREIRPAQPS